ncbi:BLMH [Cordylochernes scorpioides]|uniref:Bleomycin hydrolase n=1 Tax=Cordylochernes scorpioides TaxID=51811 RepID=A0ABY6K9K4_9ARAC|nr:BLMH [Cordylochernes scorpioides]
MAFPDHEQMYGLLHADERQQRETPLTPQILQKYRDNFESQPKNILAQNVCTKLDPYEAALKRRVLEQVNHVFSNKIETEGKPISNQKSSGRCWIFACLNAIRTQMMKHYNLEELELSQTYLFFWDKVERSNYYLNSVVEVLKRGEKVDGRLLSFLLSEPVSDGGQWDMLVNLVTRYGVVPKRCFPETFTSDMSSRLNNILRSKMREYTRELVELVSVQKQDPNPRIQEMMEEVYRVVSICLGTPPQNITWEYYNKEKVYHRVGPISPLDFYVQHVKPVYNMEDKICLVHDPRPEHKYGQAYTVDCLGNMVGGRPTFYNNQPMELLLQATAAQIKANEPVWFGCDVSKRFHSKLGILDPNLHDYKLLMGVEVNLGMSKAERLLYGESLMTHAMLFTAVTLDQEGKPTKLRVENSWGDENGDKGYLVMTADWFKEFVFEVVLDKKHLTEEVLAVQRQTPVVLPAWDPLGALA